MIIATYRSLELLETGTIVDYNLPVGQIIEKDGRYVVIDPCGERYHFGAIGNSFHTLELALEILFGWLHPDLVERSSWMRRSRS